MRNNGTGGMRTNAAGYSIICPKCGKPAARVERYEDHDRYLHYTKKDSMWHSVSKEADHAE